jgi:hypothetical protein
VQSFSNLGQIQSSLLELIQMPVLTVSAQLSGLKMAGLVTRSRLSPAHVPSLSRARRTLVVQSVAKPSGSAGKGVNAAASSGGLSGLKQLVTPFSDPKANSKMLSLAAGKSDIALQTCLNNYFIFFSSLIFTITCF